MEGERLSDRWPTLNPSQWETAGVFRETFLRLRLGPEIAETIQLFSWDIYRASLKIPGAEYSPEAALRRGLTALARDLRHDQGFLHALGSAGEPGNSVMPILQLSRHVAESLGRLAGSLETGVRIRR